jgi:hypothetical protein
MFDSRRYFGRKRVSINVENGTERIRREKNGFYVLSTTQYFQMLLTACQPCRQGLYNLGKSPTPALHRNAFPSRNRNKPLPLLLRFLSIFSTANFLSFFVSFYSCFSCVLSCRPPHCDVAAATSTRLSLASHRRPPPSSRTSLQGPSCPPPDYTPSSPPNLHPAQPDHKNSVLHPRVAVLLGVERHWHFPLLFCRALSTAPAAWWGLRCALTFMGELLLDESKEEIGAPWSVERRFRVTEVFLAVLWVCISLEVELDALQGIEE